ncbi:hypothetical protein XELAEV_18008862mg [Xenopus laevis]|uniref:Uncharacterized protein n=1 Tax=Xenopus laevis TaxID=8355 RepID=A0A974DRM5_XENLA|nr:hypothetical protein XELAEV_18008862mg [Xenopus laevis]
MNPYFHTFKHLYDYSYTNHICVCCVADININIPVGLLIRVAGGCFGLLIIAVLALYIRYCNKHVRDLREAEEELRCLQVVVQGGKIQRPQEDTKEKDDTPTKEIENQGKEVSVPTIKAEPPN